MSGLFSICGEQRMHGLLLMVASPVVEHGLSGTQASVIVARGLSCPTACGILLDQK